MRRAVFLDRDGTIIADKGYLSNPEGVELLPGVVDSLTQLREAGFALVVVSNQSAIGRGMCTNTEIEATNQRMSDLLSAAGVPLDSIRYCPHHPNDGCECRKPAPGMILAAAAELDIDLDSSVMVGDKESDVEAGVAAGCEMNILLTHEDLETKRMVAKDLSEALRIILPQEFSAR